MPFHATKNLCLTICQYRPCLLSFISGLVLRLRVKYFKDNFFTATICLNYLKICEFYKNICYGSSVYYAYFGTVAKS